LSALVNLHFAFLFVSGFVDTPLLISKLVREPIVRAIVIAMPTFILNRLMPSPPSSGLAQV
jgi:hypothetical protein